MQQMHRVFFSLDYAVPNKISFWGNWITTFRINDKCYLPLLIFFVFKWLAVKNVRECCEVQWGCVEQRTVPYKSYLLSLLYMPTFKRNRSINISTLLCLTICQVHEKIDILMCPPFGLNERTLVNFTVNWPETFPHLGEISSPEVAPVSEVTESTRSKILAFNAWTAVENMKWMNEERKTQWKTGIYDKPKWERFLHLPHPSLSCHPLLTSRQNTEH